MTKTLALFLFLVPAVHAQQGGKTPLAFYQACFGGVDNYRDSARIDDCDFQDGRNFLTDRGFLEKRPGSLRRIEEINAGFPVQYGAEFITQSNVKTLVLHAGATIYATDFSAAPVAIATVNVNSVVDSVSAFNRHYIVTGYDTPFYYDGTSAVLVSSIPTCAFLEFAHERIWCGKVAGLESTLYVGAFGDATDWTPTFPLTADSATSFTFDRQDGKPLTGVFYSPYGVLAFKRTKMFVVRGVDNDDFEKRRISDAVGCVDDRSIQLVDSWVTWLGEDGVYRWGGGVSAPELISRDIDSTIKQIRNITSNPDNQSISSFAEFQAGLSSVNGPSNAWSSSIAPGSIVPSTWTRTDTDGDDWAAGTLTNLSSSTLVGSLELGVTLTTSAFFDEFTNNNYTTNPTWELTTNTGGGTFSVPGYLNLASSAGIFPYRLLTTPVPEPSLSAYGMWSMDAKLRRNCIAEYSFARDVRATPRYAFDASYRFAEDIVDVRFFVDGAGVASYPVASTEDSWHTYSVVRTPPNTFSFYVDGVLIGSVVDYAGVSLSSATYIGVSLLAEQSSVLSIDNVRVPARSDTGSFTSQIFDTTFSTAVGGPFTFSETVPIGSTIAYSVRESSTNVASTWSSWSVVSTTTSGEYRVPLTKQYWQYKADFSTDYSTQTPSIQDVTLAATSTGTWDSAVLPIGTDITSWNQFAANVDTTRPDLLAFYTRASATTFAQDATSPAWVLQTNGENVACSTGAFVQVRAVSYTGSSTDTVKVNAVTINWQEGEASKVASLFHEKRYFLSVNASTNTTINDTTLVLQRNGKWSIFDGPNWASMWKYDFYPYAGDGLTTSKVWRIMYEDAWYDDNSTAIDAYVVTKDFQFGGQNNMKVFRQLYLESSSPEDTTLSLGRAVDKLSGYTTTTQAITGGTTFNDEIKGMFPGFARGRYLRFRFGNATLHEPLRLDGYTVLGDIEGLYRR